MEAQIPSRVVQTTLAITLATIATFPPTTAVATVATIATCIVGYRELQTESAHKNKPKRPRTYTASSSEPC